MLQQLDAKLPLDDLVAGLKAAGEPTRLRILALLATSELTVKDLTFILGQSQPRVSRHLKLMTEAGLIDRYPEGAWVYYRVADHGGSARIVAHLTALVDDQDPVRQRDQDRLASLKAELAARAEGYFSANAREWDEIRSMHVADADVEAAMLEFTAPLAVDTLVDLGTGTARMLELFSDRYQRAVGVDMSAEMLAVARAKLDAAGLTRAQVRRGDINSLELTGGDVDLVTIHQVLHFLPDPDRAIHEAARLLRPGGHMLIVDFAPHDIETLRTEHAHQRLGFSTEHISDWLSSAGLELAATRELPHSGHDEQDRLTVTLWLAKKPAGNV